MFKRFTIIIKKIIPYWYAGMYRRNRFTKYSISVKFNRLIKHAHILIIIGFFTFIFSFIGWQKHIHFQTFGWDTAVFDQQIFLTSRLQAPYSSLHKMNGLADHFHPLLLIFGAVLYRFWADPRILFILQSSVVALSAFPLYLISKYYLQKTAVPKAGIVILSCLLCLMYLFSVSVQSMTVDEIHDDVFAALPVIWLWYFLIKNNYRWFWISFIAVLLIKEEYGLLGIPLGIYIILTKRNFKQAFYVSITGILVFCLLIYFIMPKLGNRTFIHFLGNNIPKVLLNSFLEKPSLLITKMLDQPTKQQTVISSLISFGFLPVFSPVNLVLPASSLAIRFYNDTTPRRFEFNNHYASPFMPLLAVCAVSGLYNLIRLINKLTKNKWKKIWPVYAFYILMFAFIQNLIFHGPVNSLLKPSFYTTYMWEKDALALIKQVPKEVTVATQNSLLPHLSQRNNFYLLPEIGNASYIALDLEDGPNKYFLSDQQSTSKLLNELIITNRFHVIWQSGKSFLLEKNNTIK